MPLNGPHDNELSGSKCEILRWKNPGLESARLSCTALPLISFVTWGRIFDLTKTWLSGMHNGKRYDYQAGGLSEMLNK